MSDSDGVPGEIEYSDDEDYIHNQSVLSARRTKIDSSIADEHSHNHHQTHAHNHQRRSHQENQATAHVGHTQAEHNQVSQEEKEQPNHAEDSGAREEQTMGTEGDRKMEGRQEGMVSVSISQLLTTNQPQSAVLQEETMKIQSLHQQEDHTNELTNHQETGEKQLQSENHESLVENKNKQPNEQEKKIEEEANENHLQQHLSKHYAELPSSQQQQEIEAKQVKVESVIDAVPQQKEHQISEQTSHKIQTAAVQQQQSNFKATPPQQPLQQATNQQQEQLPYQQAPLQSRLESLQLHTKAEHSHNPPVSVHSQSQSQRDLLAGINIVPKSSESEFSEKVVQRKLFKTDLQKDEQDAHPSHVSHPSQDVEHLPLKQEKQMKSQLESAGDVKTNSLHEGEVKSNSVHELMNIPQRKSRAEDLNEKRREDTLPTKSEACKCVIM